MARKARRKNDASPTAPAALSHANEHSPATTNGSATKRGQARRGAVRTGTRRSQPAAARPKRTQARTSSRSKRRLQRRRRPHLSDARRQEILQIAAREGLTGAQVSKRFGISQVTFYLWRKKAGVTGGVQRRRATNGAPMAVDGMRGTIRAQVRSAIQAMLPKLITEEIAAALGERRRR